MISRGAQIAETAVTRNRAVQIYTQGNLSTVFPEALNRQTQSYYTAALSNYVQDQWHDAYHLETCKLNPSLCADDEQTFFEKVREQINPYQMPFLDLDPIGVMFGTVWTTARDVYGTIKSFKGILDPASISKLQIGSDAQNYAAYHQYLLNCATLQPVAWVRPDTPLVTSPMGMCFGDCP